MSVSIGLASSTHPGLEKETDLLGLADRACYLAKEQGKRRVGTPDELFAHREPQPPPPSEAPAEGVDAESRDYTGQIMVVDDEDTICELFQAMLTAKGFSVVTETSASRALDFIRTNHESIDVVLTDLRMPEMDGIQMLEAVRKISPDTVMIVVTGFSSVENAIAALRVGAYDFVRKPVDFNELEFVVRRAVERRYLRRQVESYRQHLEKMLDHRTRSLRDAIAALENSYMATMEALSTIISVREVGTALHNSRVSEYSVFLARRMRMSSKQLMTIRRGALLHDIGKIGVPDAVLLKPGPLTPEEMDLVKQHPVLGHQILSSIPFLADEAEMVLSHHERPDGTGYPRGISGDAICLGARIFAVADTFDAVRSDRAYRKAATLETAVQIIREGAGSQFDLAVVEVFLNGYPEMVQGAVK
jgi:response regulator RpfG family c-di-GMP phosphodiesterase